MELTMAAQDDPTPWEVHPPPPESLETSEISALGGSNTPERALPGRAYFSRLGIVRRKPSRPDAPQTLSKSCSDKLALHQCVSLLAGVTSLLVSQEGSVSQINGGACHGPFLSSLILPETQYSRIACSRAFSAEGRLAPLATAAKQRSDRGDRSLPFVPFAIHTTSHTFAYSRASGIAPTNISAAWVANGAAEGEGLVGGTVDGRKATVDARGASFVSRGRLWRAAREVAELLDSDSFQNLRTCLASTTYGELKRSPLLELRRVVKQQAIDLALKGWIANEGDDRFELPKS